MLYAKRIHKLFQLWFQVLFFSVGLFFLFGPELSAHDYFPSLIKSLLPVSSKQYWYFSSYVGVFLLAPGLNLVAKILAEYFGGNKTKKLVLFSIVILICLMWSDPFGFNDGYSSAWLAYLYLIGAVIYALGIDKSISKTHIIIALTITVFTVIFFSRSTVCMLPVDILTGRTLPTVLVPSIMVLVWFSKISVRSSRVCNIVIWVSSSVFAVYLLHDNRFFRETFISNKFSIEAIGSVNPLLYMFAISVLIFMAGILLDKFRLLLFNKTLIARLSNYVSSRRH